MTLVSLRRRSEGSPVLLTESEQLAIVQALRLGTPVAIASEAAGVASGTLKTWMARGREERARREAGEEPDRRYDRHLALVDVIDKAKAEGMVSHVVSISRAAQSGKWQAAAWMLSRTAPEEFGPPEQRIRHLGDEADDSPRESIAERLDQMAQRLGVGTSDDDDVGTSDDDDDLGTDLDL